MLDDILGSLFGGLFDFTPKGRRLNRLLKRGETTTARIDGIRITSDGDGDNQYYRLLLADGQVAGVRQMLRPQSELERLGGEVLVRRYKGRVVIDWPATLARTGTAPQSASIHGKPKRKPPERGIHDYHVNRKRLERGTRVEAELLGLEPVLVMGMPTENWNLHLRVERREALAKRVLVPSYALYLLHPGTRLPVSVEPKRITVDWITAAERDYAPRP